MSYESYVTKCRDIITYADSNSLFNPRAVKSMLTNSEKYCSFTPKQQAAIDNIIEKWKIPSTDELENKPQRYKTFVVDEKDSTTVLLFLLQKGITRYETFC